MKLFKKVLSVILAAVLMLTVFPLAVFADDPSPAPTGAVQGQKGTGESGTVTVSVSASQLASLLRALDDEDAAKDALNAIITREGNPISIDEILDIIPLDNLISLVIGENGEYVADLIDALGGLDRVLEMVDVNALIDSADSDRLSNFISGTTGIESTVKTEEMKAYLSGLSADDVKALFGSNYNAFVTAVSDAIKAGTLTDNNGNALAIGDLVDFSAINAGDFEDQMQANADKLLDALNDMLATGTITIPADAYDVNTANLGNDALRSGLVAKLKTDADSILTSSGLDAAANVIANNIGSAETLLSSANGTEIKSRAVDAIKADGTLADNIITSAGWTWLQDEKAITSADQITPAIFDELRQDGGRYDANELKSLLVNVVTTNHIDVSDLFDQVTVTSSDINAIFAGGNYNAEKLFRAVLDVVNDNDLSISDYVTVHADKLLADPDVSAFFKNNITDYFTATEIVDILGNISNYLKSTIYSYNSLVNLAADYVDKTKVVEKLKNDGQNLLDYIDLDAMLDLPALDLGALFKLFSSSVLANQLKDDYRALLGALSNDQRTKVINLLVSTFMEKFEYITVEGYRVAYKADGLVLSLDADAIIAAVWEVLPKLQELADDGFDGTILSFNVTAKYETQDGRTVEKDVNFVLRVTSGVDTIRRAAAVLNRYLKVEKNGSMISVEVDMPAAAADLYRKLLETGNTEAVNSLREKLLRMEGMTGAEMLEAFDDIPLSEIIDALDDVDIDELYTRLYNAGIVQRALTKLEDLAGVSYDLSKLDTLDEILDQMRRDDLPSIERIVEKLSEKLNVDLMEVLEKVAKVADENAYVQKLLEKAAELPKVGQYVEGISAEDVLNEYKGMNPVKAVAQFISDRVGRDLVSKLYEEHTAAELYAHALDFAEARLSGYYEKFQTLLINLSDPDYESDNRFVKLVQSVVPARALSAFRSHSLTDLYRGNSVFTATADQVSVNLGSVATRLINLAKRYVNIDSGMEAMIRDFLPSGTVDFGVSLKLDFTNVYQVTYYDADGVKLATTFLPKGTDPEVIAVPEIEGKTVKGWATEPNGEAVSAVTGDCSLYASYLTDVSAVSFRFFNGTTYEDLPAAEVETGTKLTAAQLPALPAAATLHLVEGGYTLVWFKGETVAKDGEQVDVLNVDITGDVTYTAAYLPVDLVEDSDAIVYLTTDDENNWTATVIDATDVNVTVDITNPAFTNPATAPNSLTVRSVKNGEEAVSMAISPELLATLKAAGSSNIRVVSKKSAGTREFQNGTIYTATAKEVYNFELLVDVDDSDPNSGTALTDFDGGLTVTVKTTEITPVTKDDKKQTNVYIVENDGSVSADAVTDIQVSETAGTVSFKPPHFTEIVIVNEYRLTAQFTYGGTAGTGLLKINGTALPDEGMMIPEDAIVHNLVPVITGANAALYKVSSMSAGGTDVAIGGDMTMPHADTVVTVTCTAIEFGFLWKMPDGSVLETKDAAVAWLNANPNAAPDGYRFTKDAQGNYVFENADLNPEALHATVYCTPALTPVEYEIVFRPGHDAADITAKFTVEDIANGTFLPPELPEIAGYVGVAWANYNLSAIKAGGSNVVAGIYTERVYTVTYVNGTTSNAVKGTQINALVGYIPTEGTEIDRITLVLADGTEQTAESTFTMPASDVCVVITERAKTAKVRINGQEVQGKIGDVLTFEVKLAKDELLAEAPKGARLVSFTTGADGSRTLLYAVDVAESNPDLTYRVEKISAKDSTINNGLLGGEADKDKAVRYATSPDTTFPSAVYSFAVYESAGRVSTGLIWLWVLLIVLLVVAIIVLLYFIILRKGWGPNLFTRIIVAIVTFLGTICLGVYALFSGLAFKKNKDE